MLEDQLGSGARDDTVVLPPVSADPLFVDAVDEAVAGPVEDLPDAQPQRTLGTTPGDFASLYIRHRSSFALHASRFLRDKRDIDEVLQEAFLRLFLAIPELETELQALSYCRRTVTNLCIDRYRADQRRPHLVDLDETTADLYDEASYDDPVLRAEDAAIVRQALALLSPLHRAALVKREIEEKPLPQIAAELEIPEESVKHVLHRARRALRRLLVGTSVEPGVDLDALPTAEIYEIARARLARGVTGSAKSLLMVFVSVLTVVGGWRATSVTNGPDGGSVSEAPSGVSVAPDDLHVHSHGEVAVPHTSAPSQPPRAGVAAPTIPSQVPRVVVTPRTPRASSNGVTSSGGARSPIPQRKPVPVPPAVPPVVSTPDVPAPEGDAYTIAAPSLSALGTAQLFTNSVEVEPSGQTTTSTVFAAPTATGDDFALHQTLTRDASGEVSLAVAPVLPANMSAGAPANASPTYVTQAPDGSLVVHVDLTIPATSLPPATVTAMVTASNTLSTNELSVLAVHPDALDRFPTSDESSTSPAVLTVSVEINCSADLTRVVGEHVTVEAS